MRGKKNTLTDLLERLGPPDENGCRPWPGAHDMHGYGEVRWEGDQRGVHRVIWEQVMGAIPAGRQVHHTCRRRDCCNVQHMALVTPMDHQRADSLAAAVNAAKTHCKHGHEFTPDNTRLDPRGHRICLACHREHNRAWMAAHYRDLPSYQNRRQKKKADGL